MNINTKLTQEDINQYYELTEQGLSQRQACTILGISRGIIQHYLKRVAELENIEDTVLGVQNQNDYTDWQSKPKPELQNVFQNAAKGLSKLGESLKKFSQTKHGEEFDDFELFDDKKTTHSKQTIIVVADTQAKPTESLEYMLWIGAYIAETKPDVVVHIGDHYDMPSLSSYDKGKASSEGRRFVDDLEAGNKGLELLNLSMHKDIKYKPRKVFCKGNHEHRIDRYVEDNPELKGTIGTEFLPLEKYGWEVYDFLQPVEIGGIYFVHYLANPFSGKPYGGNAMNILKTVGRSFVVGHKQTLDSAIRPTIDGKLQLGIINGACYPFNEKYKGFQGNNHFRGITVLTEVEDGFGCPSFVSLSQMRDLYYG